MAKSIQELLHVDNLTGLIRNPVNAVPANILPPGFTQRGRNVSGQTATWYKVEGNRETARLVNYGSPAKHRALRGISRQTATMLHTFESIKHDPFMLVNLMQYDNPEKQALGNQEISRQTDDFNQLFENLLVCSVYSALGKGAIYFDGDGNLLPSSSGAVTTVSYGVPSGNQNQLDIDGNGAVLDVPWDNAAANIIDQLVDLKSRMRKLTGYEIRHAFYGSSIPGWLAVNTQLKGLFEARPDLAGQFLNGTIPEIAGIQFHPAYDAFYVDANGATQNWWANDAVVFTPDPSPEWWEIFNGSSLVPTNVGAIGNEASSAMPREVFGRFSYAKQSHDPVTVEQYAGDTFLPVIKVPGAICIADVDF